MRLLKSQMSKAFEYSGDGRSDGAGFTAFAQLDSPYSASGSPSLH